jgi:NTE family protein
VKTGGLDGDVVGQPPARRALVLGGGGARGAYQVGATLAVLEIARDAGLERPFSILSGLSAGAINAVYLASRPDDPVRAARDLTALWSRLTADRVFRADAASLARIGFGWLVDLALGGLKRQVEVKSLLDTTPLANLLRSHLSFERLRAGIADGSFDTVLLTAASYATLRSVSFVQTARPAAVPTDASDRRSMCVTTLTRDHVLASAAIPLLFPPVRIAGEYFGDGALKNSAPLGGAVRMGATSLCVIGVHRSGEASESRPGADVRPTAAQLLGALLDALFMDNLDSDVERLMHVNRVIEGERGTPRPRGQHRQRVIEGLYLLPSRDVGELALEHLGAAPSTIRYLMRGLGSEVESATLLSYLLFEPPFCTALADLGYRDTWDKKDSVRRFLDCDAARYSTKRTRVSVPSADSIAKASSAP